MQINQVPSEVPKPSKEEFNMWRKSPTGTWFFNWIERDFLGEVQEMVAGSTVNIESAEETALKTVRMQTKQFVLWELMMATYEDINNTLDDDQESRSNPDGEQGDSEPG